MVCRAAKAAGVSLPFQETTCSIAGVRRGIFLQDLYRLATKSIITDCSQIRVEKKGPIFLSISSHSRSSEQTQTSYNRSKLN